MEYQEVQNIEKQTMKYIREIITPGMKLLDIRKQCEAKMIELGADSFWYWDVGAFVFSGNETTVSVSGKTYHTTDKVIASDEIITIDLSPQHGNTWGDYARTIILQDGNIVENIAEIRNKEWKNGLLMEDFLHEELYNFATPETTFEELYFHMNHLIRKKGFLNLDFSGNLGHSIVREKKDRIYIEIGNNKKLGDVSYFTFEPHISVPNSHYGYKKENIYYFDNKKLTEL